MKPSIKRRYLATGAATVFAVAVSVPVVSALADEPAAEYEQATLPVPDGFEGSAVTQVDPSGQYVVGHVYEGNISTPVLWKDGEYEVVEIPDAETAYLWDVNSAGLAVGVYNTEDEQTVFTYQDGEIADVTTGFDVRALTENGDIVGSVADGDTNVAAILPAGGEEAELLDVPDEAEHSVAAGANDDGSAAGTYRADSVSHPVAWDQDGAVAELELPGELEADTYIRMDAVAGDFAVGHVAETPGVYGSIVWNLAEGGEGTIVSESQMYQDINSQGWTVGYEDGPALQADGELITLSEDDGMATSLSQDGSVIAGELDTEDDTKEAVIWTATE